MAEQFSAHLPARLVKRDDSDTPEAFAPAVGFLRVDGTGGAGPDHLQVAICHHNEMVRKFLALRRPSAPWHRTVVGSTAFFGCCLSGNVVTQGDISLAIMSSPNKLGASPIRVAAVSGHVELVELTLMHGGEVDLSKASYSSASGCTPLHCASSNHHVEVCQLLLRCRTNLWLLATRRQLRALTRFVSSVREKREILLARMDEGHLSAASLVLECCRDTRASILEVPPIHHFARGSCNRVLLATKKHHAKKILSNNLSTSSWDWCLSRSSWPFLRTVTAGIFTRRRHGTKRSCVCAVWHLRIHLSKLTF